MTTPTARPLFIVSSDAVEEKLHQYPNSDELHGSVRRVGREAGLTKTAVNLVRLGPGRRSSFPHAESLEEEFVYVLQGTVEAWVDGVTYAMIPGDFAAFPSGTGRCHTFINNSETEVVLLVGGEADRNDNQIFYPHHPQRRNEIPPHSWWSDIRLNPQGPHDGLPDALRSKQSQ
jgi:uncharacterized cupin superfamily protein